jgi:hypothetical protein
VVRSWIDADDRRLRRTSVIAQLGARSATDLGLLADAIEANQDDPDAAVGGHAFRVASTETSS